MVIVLLSPANRRGLNSAIAIGTRFLLILVFLLADRRLLSKYLAMGRKEHHNHNDLCQQRQSKWREESWYARPHDTDDDTDDEQRGQEGGQKRGQKRGREGGGGEGDQCQRVAVDKRPMDDDMRGKEEGGGEKGGGGGKKNRTQQWESLTYGSRDLKTSGPLNEYIKTSGPLNECIKTSGPLDEYIVVSAVVHDCHDISAPWLSHATPTCRGSIARNEPTAHGAAFDTLYKPPCAPRTCHAFLFQKRSSDCHLARPLIHIRWHAPTSTLCRQVMPPHGFDWLCNRAWAILPNVDAICDWIHQLSHAPPPTPSAHHLAPSEPLPRNDGSQRCPHARRFVGPSIPLPNEHGPSVMEEGASRCCRCCCCCCDDRASSSSLSSCFAHQRQDVASLLEQLPVQVRVALLAEPDLRVAMQHSPGILECYGPRQASFSPPSAWRPDPMPVESSSSFNNEPFEVGDDDEEVDGRQRQQQWPTSDCCTQSHRFQPLSLKWRSFQECQLIASLARYRCHLDRYEQTTDAMATRDFARSPMG